MTMNIEAVTVYKIGAIQFNSYEDAEKHIASFERAEAVRKEHEGMRLRIRDYNRWLSDELRAHKLMYNASGCTHFTLTYPEKILERLGYEVIEEPARAPIPVKKNGKKVRKSANKR